MKEVPPAHVWLLLLTMAAASGPFVFGGRPDLRQAFAAGGVTGRATREPAPETPTIPGAPPAPGDAIAGLPPAAEAPPEGAFEEPPLQTEGSAAADLLATITTGSFAKREDVSTGRFLQSFDAVRLEIGTLDTSKIQVHRLGEGWVLIEVPGLPGRAPERNGNGARLRLVHDENTWKVENLRLLH
jgi:hypothetical protein